MKAAGKLDPIGGSHQSHMALVEAIKLAEDPFPTREIIPTAIFSSPPGVTP
jgi:hypothetical protein